MSTAMWKLDKDLCRCCHAEGAFKHLSDPCFQLGQEEIYSDMLQDCLDVKIVPMTGVLSDVTYTICESCVARLRDASNFKRQVQDCEERFKDMYSKNMIKCGNMSPDYEVKEEPMAFESDEPDADMKQEYQSVDEDDEDDDDAFMKFDDEDSLDLEEREELITIQIKGEPKGKGKGKAKPKPKLKKVTPPAKKAKPTKEKPIKVEAEELTEAAVSGEKKKGKAVSECFPFCAVNEDVGSETYTCKVCDKTFKKWKYFKDHYYNVHKVRKKTRPCSICKEEVLPWRKAKHLEEAHGQEPPTCGACEKKFAFPHALVRHQKNFHLAEKNFKCDQCQMAFVSPSKLKQHSYRHSAVKDFKCKLCTRTLKSPHTLKEHMKIHLNVRNYACKICDVSFVQCASFKYHMAKRHPNV